MEEHSRERSVGRRIHILDRWMKLFLEEELKELDVSMAQFRFLLPLFHQDGVTQEQLTERVYVDKATTARAISKLEETGYIKREKDPEDKRAYRLFLTKKAKDFHPKMKTIMEKWTEMLTQDLTEKEKETLLALLDKMVANAPDCKCRGGEE